jgi:hypothetical protein
MRVGLAFACASALSLPAGAQLRPAPHARCVVTAHAAVALDDALDPLAPPALLPLDGVTVLAWRDRAGALRVQRFAPDLRSLEEPRVLAEPVSVFTMARTPTGFALAYVERGQDLVVARRSASMEAQNVPRVVEALTAPVTSLALAPVEEGLLLAWATPSAVRVMPLDARAVPRSPSSVASDQPGARSVRLDAAEPTTLRVDASDPAVEPWVLTLLPDGSVASRARWPIGALGPVRLGGASLTAQINPAGSPMLLRSNAIVAPAALADPAVEPRARLDALALDRDLVVAMVSDAAAGRQSLARLLPDGSASWLTGVRGVVPGPATLAVQSPAAVLLLTRDASHSPARTTLQRYACALP